MKKILFIITVLFSCKYATDHMPKNDFVESTKELPIDGLYRMNDNMQEKLKIIFGVIDPEGQRVQFEKGKAYYVESSWGKGWGRPGIEAERVFLKNIKKVSEYRYSALFYPEGIDTVYDITLLVEKNNLVMNLVNRGVLKMDYTYTFVLIK